ncbi:hypothetical protein, partial [Corallococcus sp. CA041A]|uniref:hypothetical protein n=1 Tax=Corallococcus sp. CA041A TaxID=2316727 RepID=UPI001F234086
MRDKRQPGIIEPGESLGTKEKERLCEPQEKISSTTTRDIGEDGIHVVKEGGEETEETRLAKMFTLYKMVMIGN